MKKVAFLMVSWMAASWLVFSPVHAVENRSARIKRLQAEARIAQLNAQAAAETQRAYEEAWRKTKSAAKGAACVAGGLYAAPAVAVACYAHNAFRNK
jgi:uncharacterized membrane protein YqiK